MNEYDRIEMTPLEMLIVAMVVFVGIGSMWLLLQTGGRPVSCVEITLHAGPHAGVQPRR